MSFEREGWLGDAVHEITSRCDSEFAPNLAVARRANMLAHEVVDTLQVERENARQVIASTLFIRVLESTQAAVHLIRLGFRHDAAAVIRVSVESLILLANACSDGSFAKAYVAKGSQKALFRTQSALPEEARNELDSDLRVRLEATESKFKQMVEDLGKGSGSLERLAETAGLKGLYDTVYRFLSASVHSELSVVADYLDESPKGGVAAIDYAPDWRYAGVYLLITCEVLVKAMERLESLFGGDRAEKRAAILRELEVLSPKWPDSKRRSL